MSNIGKLTVTAIQGRNFRNCETFSKQDPYLTYKLGDARGRTKTNKNGGTSPTWNETTHLPVSSSETKMRIRAYDEDLIGKDCIGEGTVDLTPVIAEGEHDAWYPIFSNKKLAGEVYLELTFTKN